MLAIGLGIIVVLFSLTYYIMIDLMRKASQKNESIVYHGVKGEEIIVKVNDSNKK